MPRCKTHCRNGDYRQMSTIRLKFKKLKDNITCAVKSMSNFMTNDHCQRAVVDISGRETLHIVITGLLSKQTVLAASVATVTEIKDSRAGVSSVDALVVKALRRRIITLETSFLNLSSVARLSYQHSVDI